MELSLAGGAQPAGLGREPEPEGAKAGGEPGPTPVETEALAWAEINETTQRRLRPGARGLNNYLRDVAHAFITPKGDERTNIIDQGARATYYMAPEPVQALLRHLEAMRLEGSVAHFSERQGTPAVPRCGLMLDYDVVTATKKPALTDRHFYRLAGVLVGALQRDFDLAAHLPPLPGGRPPQEARLHVFFIVKPEALPIAAGAGAGAAGGAADAGAGAAAAGTGAPLYKYGFHVLVPGFKVGRAYKKWLLRGLRADPAVGATLAELGAVGDPAECLDLNSASVPVLFFGSCKRGAVPYDLGAALEVTIDVGAYATGGWAIKKLTAADLAGYNLVAEMSLTTEAAYEDGREPLVRKHEFEPRPEVAEKAQDWGDRSQGGATPGDELLLAEHSLSTLTLHNAEARHLHALLDLLGEEYYTDRNRWRDVVFALANTNENYKPLAVWFSHKCPQKWAGGGLAALDQLWEDALSRRGGPDRPLTLRSISYWARCSNPQRYAEVMERSYFTMLTGYVYQSGGRLQHYMVAKVLHTMLGAKFCVDVTSGPRGGQAYCWFEFVLPGQPMTPGEVWKWRKETEPDDLHIYMSEKLTRVLEQISEHLEEKRAQATEEAQAKYYRNVAKAFAGSVNNMYQDTFKNGVVRQANYLFRRRGFAESLDRDPHLFGTLNGVLRLGARCEFIDHYHEHPVSRYSPVAWRRFDPDDPWTRLALGAIADIIVEPDARDWILFHACQGLSGEEKEGLALLWEGGGQNGKTAFLRQIAKTLGPCAGKFNIQLLSSQREDADRPNSALMRFEHLNYAYAEETNKAESLNVARMKELVNAGEISGRDLNEKQKEFTVRANITCASQYGFVIDTVDHGTWRRLRRYRSKAQFRKKPDPSNPYEKLDDQRFVRQYPRDPQYKSAVLSILTHYYERLQNEYGGELKNVRSPTIERETEEFRIGQDTLHRWVCEAVVVSPECGIEYALGVLSGYFMDWYTANIDRKRHVAGEIIKEIESSALSKYLRPAPNGARVLVGCRILAGPDGLKVRPGEEPVSTVEMRGGRSAAEWAEAVAEARDSVRVGAGDLLADGLPWWAARAARAPPRPPENGDGDLPDDDAAVMRADRRRPEAAAGPPEALADDELEALLAGDWGGPPPGRCGLDEVYDGD